MCLHRWSAGEETKWLWPTYPAFVATAIAWVAPLAYVLYRGKGFLGRGEACSLSVKRLVL